MKQRFSVNDRGELVDRHGYVLGRIVALTIDSGEGGGFKGGVGDVVEVENELTPHIPPPDEQPGEQQRIEEIDVPVLRRLGDDGQPVALISESGSIEALWEHYVAVMEPRRRELDPATRTLLRDALKVGTLAEWKRAVDGCFASDVHMGRRGINGSAPKKYNRPSHIFKGKRGIRTTREQLDLFLDIAEKRGVQSQRLSADPARFVQAKRNVLDAWEFPADRDAQEAGEMSAAWLAQHGYRVERADDGRPTFVEVDQA